jgi:flagellar biosynthesis/type III secretory pathway M-ring protein FliF/YscJ
VTVRQTLPLVVAVAALVLVVVVLATQVGQQKTDTGLVVDVEATGLAEVRGFTLRASDGREIEYRVGVLENAAAFPPGHLYEHRATAQAIRVFYREESGARVAYRLEDASGG